MARKGQTYGKVKQSAFANRLYFKPSLRKVVIRHPGVMRRSDKVIAVNQVLENLRGKAEHPSRVCKIENLKAKGYQPTLLGRFECLRAEMQRIIPGGKA